MGFPGLWLLRKFAVAVVVFATVVINPLLVLRSWLKYDNCDSCNFYPDYVPNPPEVEMPLSIPDKFSEALRGIFQKIEHTPQSLVDWSHGEELWHPHDIGTLTSEESQVPTQIIALLPGHDTLRHKHKSAIIRVWWCCRQAMSREESVASGRTQATSDDQPIPQDVTDPCHAQWKSITGSRILSGKLLVDTMLNSMFRELSARPRRLSVRLAETLRTQTCISKQDSHALVMRPGQSVQKMGEVNDEVPDRYNLWIRVRAWLYSVAFLTVQEISPFLTPGKAEYYSEMMLEMMHARFGGSPAPLLHFVNAYLQSARIWTECIRDGHTLEFALCQEASWRHLWTTYNSNAVSLERERPGNSKSLPNGGQDLDPKISEQLERLRQQNRDYQSQRDKALAQLKRDNRAGGGGKGDDNKRRRVNLKPPKPNGGKGTW